MAGMVFGQGSLTPPGAPGATMKSLEQLDQAIAGVSNAVEQVETRIDLATVAGNANHHHIINQPGSYYLSGNLGVTKTRGISIYAANVTLDLNGFTVSRSAGTGGYGIYVFTTGNQATVRDGSVSGFQSGIVASSGAECVSLFNIKASQCSEYGIYAYGAGARLVDCIATRNTGGGIYARNGASLSGCIASYNRGMYGIYANYGSTLSDCTASFNTGIGSSSYGIYTLRSSVIGCTASNNSNTNSPGTSSQGVGIYVSGGLVKDCAVSNNRGDGIWVGSDSLVSGNQCESNGNGGDGAGIHVIGTDNRIENNTVTDNDRGIDVDQVGNFIVRNTASGNTTNWTVVSGNVCLVVQAATSGAISGNSGGTAPGSTDPNANFTY
jgi:parallel beta-helix repeat protein